MTLSSESKVCNDEFFDYFHGRIYYFCELKKGHKGNHKHTSITKWNSKGEGQMMRTKK